MSTRPVTRTVTFPTLGRFAALALRLGERRDLVARLADLVEPLRAAGVVVVAGEAELLGELRERLSQAAAAVRQLADTDAESGTRAGAVTVLDRLDQLTSGPAWEVAADMETSLTRQLREQEAFAESLTGTWRAWTMRLVPLKRALDDAVAVGALVDAERAAEERLSGLVDQLGRALADKLLGDAAVAAFRLDNPSEPTPVGPTVASTARSTFNGAVAGLIAGGILGSIAGAAAGFVGRHPDVGVGVGGQDSLDTRSPDELTAAIRRATAERTSLARRAELILLRTQGDTLVEFTLMLRTPSARGGHGSNLQGSATIVVQDEATFGSDITRITEEVNAGRRARDLRPRTGPAPQADPEAVLRAAGEMTYRLLVPDVIDRLLTEPSQQCTLTITTNHLTVPWELMHDGHEFLCLRRPLARMPMDWAFPRQVRGPAGTGNDRLRFLLVHADPHGTIPRAREEVETIGRRLGERWREHIDVTTLIGEEATGAALNKALRSGRWDVVHFAGHAEFNDERPALSGLLLHDGELFFAQKVQRLLEGQPLVFLNACRTGTSDDDPGETSYLAQPAEGLAASFVYGGAPGCVGSLWPVFDTPAAEFAVAFYNEILCGQLVGEALRSARLQIREAFPGEITWASYVLYGDPAIQIAVPETSRA